MTATFVPYDICSFQIMDTLLFHLGQASSIFWLIAGVRTTISFGTTLVGSIYIEIRALLMP